MGNWIFGRIINEQRVNSELTLRHEEYRQERDADWLG
jgi:hypothetical protein